MQNFFQRGPSKGPGFGMSFPGAGRKPSLTYAIIAVNPARWRHANYLDAMLLVGWVTSPEGQKIIGDFRLGGERLFVPDAVPATE